LDITLKRALAAAARAFAEEMERGLPPDPGPAEGIPVPGSSRSMIEVLSSVVRINDEQHRGASDEEMREIAQRAGMDPRGMAGYYAANLLEKRDDGLRWVSGQTTLGNRPPPHATRQPSRRTSHDIGRIRT
jgi:hypothetical protein